MICKLQNQTVVSTLPKAGKFCYAFGINTIFILTAYYQHMIFVLSFIAISTAQNLFLLHIEVDK